MTRFFRISGLATVAAGVAALWATKGVIPALAMTFSILAFLFVLAMKVAAAEILRFEREQRPDLYA